MKQIDFYLKYFSKVIPKFVDFVFYKKTQNNELTIITSEAFSLSKFSKENSLFKLTSLNDICVVDNVNRQKRFEICYNLLSVNRNIRFFFKAYTNTQIRSLSNIFNSAN